MKSLPLLPILAAVLLFPTLATASSIAPGPRPYRLTPDSRYLEGCFDACACPISMDDARGRMVLVHRGAADGFDLFSVQEVMWDVPNMKPGQRVTGTGTWRIHRDDQVQQLELDLRFGSNPARHYDSGLVPVTAAFPAIDAQVSVDALFCFDFVFEVRAAPVTGGAAVNRQPLRSLSGPTTPVLPATWGGIKARHGD